MSCSTRTSKELQVAYRWRIVIKLWDLYLSRLCEIIFKQRVCCLTIHPFFVNKTWVSFLSKLSTETLFKKSCSCRLLIYAYLWQKGGGLGNLLPEIGYWVQRTLQILISLKCLFWVRIWTLKKQLWELLLQKPSNSWNSLPRNKKAKLRYHLLMFENYFAIISDSCTY